MIEEVNNRGHQEVSFNNEGDIPPPPMKLNTTMNV